MPDSSHLGVLATSRHGENYSNRAVSVDGRYRLSYTDTVQGQAVWSRTDDRIGGSVTDLFDGDTESDTAIFLGYDHTGANWIWDTTYQRFGQTFRADFGFIDQLDFSQIDGGLGYVWRGSRGTKLFNDRKLEVRALHAKTLSSGDTLSRSLQVIGTVDMRGDTSLMATFTHGDRRFSGVVYDIQTWRLDFRSRALNGLVFSTRLEQGDAIDFTNSQAAERVLVQQLIEYAINRHLLIQSNYLYQKLEVGSADLLSQHLADIRLRFHFGRKGSLLLSAIYNSIERNRQFFQASTVEDMVNVDAQMSFSYEWTPRTALYVGYSTKGAYLKVTVSLRNLK